MIFFRSYSEGCEFGKVHCPKEEVEEEEEEEIDSTTVIFLICCFGKLKHSPPLSIRFVIFLKKHFNFLQNGRPARPCYKKLECLSVFGVNIISTNLSKNISIRRAISSSNLEVLDFIWQPQIKRWHS